MKQILYKREKTLLTIVTLLLSILLSTIELRGSEQTVYKNSVAEGDSSIVHDPYWGTNINQNVGIVLVISSFNPETKSTASFIERLSQNLEDEAPGLYRILVEDLAARNFSEDGWIWKWRVQKLLQKYKNRNLRAIITVGQEAWAALIAQERLPKKVPIFGSHISLNGIELPTAPITDNWEPKWISATQRGRNLANDWAGGLAFNPLPNKTIRLIESLFPNTTDIAFTVDNTYGGQSMKAFIREHLPLAFTSLNLHFLDASKYYLYQLQDSVLNLPPTSAIVIATWKVNRDGLYFSSGSLESLLKQRKDLPVFTLSGKGIEDIAIGGYFPSYSFDPKNIISQFLNFERGSRERLRFIVSSSHYSFNNKLLTEYKLSQNQLPLHSEIINIDDSRLKTYRSYTAALILITLLLAILLIVLIYLFRDQGKLKRELEKNAEELIEAKERAEESNRLKSAFIANISHEIRTPLNSIIGFSNILSDSALSPQERDDAQKIVTHNSELLLTQISDLLDISQIESGNLTLNYSHVNINLLCKTLIYNFEKLNKRAVDYKLISNHSDLLLKSDPKRLEQIISILLNNATKFTEEGEIVLEYQLAQASEEGGGTVTFSVADTGCGIPREKQHQLFQIFTKLNNFEQGTGLGLSIAKQLITRLGGTIWIDSYYTKGAKFIFTHPL